MLTPLITCEHAGNFVPEKYKSLFADYEKVLDSHEGWDPGAWEVALHLGDYLKSKPIGCQTSRLLIETNRSLDSHQLFSKFTNTLDKAEKNDLIQNHYLSYRREVESKIAQLTKPVLHLSIHSFTPTFNEVERKVDIGLLFDPERQRELVFCNRLKESLSELLTGTTILFNEPYRGIDDGFTTHLRGKYDDSSYLGIEIEISQKYTPDLKAIKKALSIAIDRTMTSDIF